MQAGRMKCRLTLLEPVNVEGRTAKRVVYKETRTVHAERVKARGRRSEEAGEHFPDYSVEFNIRDAHPVDNNWRVRQLGGYEYTVTNIIPNQDRGMNTLVCERLNP